MGKCIVDTHTHLAVGEEVVLVGCRLDCVLHKDLHAETAKLGGEHQGTHLGRLQAVSSGVGSHHGEVG